MDITNENFDSFNIQNISYINLPTIDYEDRCDKFTIMNKGFQRQFFPYFNARINRMTKMIESKAKEKWGNSTNFFVLNQLNDTTEDEHVCLVGVIFKHMERHQSILKEVDKDFEIIPTEETNFLSENDFVMLQQGKDSIRLSGNIIADDLVTGVMIAVIGHNEDVTNSFIVKDYCFAGPVNCVDRPIIENDQFIVLISGLGFQKDMPLDLIESLNGLTEYLIGFNNEESARETSQVVKLIIAGNCISKKVRQEEEEENAKAIAQNQWGKKLKTQTIDLMDKVDKWIYQIGKFLEVDIMPGELDPASIIMPQQPMHIGILPRCSTLKTIRCLTNPYESSINGTVIMGCSGQTVDSIRSYSKYEDTLDILKQKLIWSHQAPTAPDALYSYPFLDKDPFALEECPHILFAGNQEHFNTQTFKNNDQDIRLISIPSFENKLTCVLVNLKNLKCDFMAFN